MRRVITILVIILLATPAAARDQVTVTRVVDGDTLTIYYNNKKENVRLVGIDTPESRDNSKARRDADRTGRDLQVITSQGKRAAAFVKSLVGKGSVLEIEFDVERRDRYGRLLAYLYLSDGRMLNEEIVRAGYASVMTIPPNGKYKDRFLKAYREARESRVGLWGE